MNRYLSTIVLMQSLELLSVLRLSHAFRMNQSLYYEAFEQAENPLNKGELTDFVEFFFKYWISQPMKYWKF